MRACFEQVGERDKDKGAFDEVKIDRGDGVAEDVADPTRRLLGAENSRVRIMELACVPKQASVYFLPPLQLDASVKAR